MRLHLNLSTRLPSRYCPRSRPWLYLRLCLYLQWCLNLSHIHLPFAPPHHLTLLHLCLQLHRRLPPHPKLPRRPTRRLLQQPRVSPFLLPSPPFPSSSLSTLPRPNPNTPTTIQRRPRHTRLRRQVHRPRHHRFAATTVAIVLGGSAVDGGGEPGVERRLVSAGGGPGGGGGGGGSGGCGRRRGSRGFGREGVLALAEETLHVCCVSLLVLVLVWW